MTANMNYDQHSEQTGMFIRWRRCARDSAVTGPRALDADNARLPRRALLQPLYRELPNHADLD